MLKHKWRLDRRRVDTADIEGRWGIAGVAIVITANE